MVSCFNTIKTANYTLRSIFAPIKPQLVKNKTIQNLKMIVGVVKCPP